MPIRVVCFDAFGTLVRPRDGRRDSFGGALRSYGHPVDARAMVGLQRDAEGSSHVAESRSESAYLDWTGTTMARVVAGEPLGSLPNGAVVPALEQHHEVALEVFEDVAEAVEVVRRHGLEIAVSSNFCWDLAERLDRAGVPVAEIASVVTSARIGYRKPHPLAYAAVTEACGVDAASVAFIGDSPVADLEGPLGAGMAACLVARTASVHGEGGTATTLVEAVEMLVRDG